MGNGEGGLLNGGNETTKGYALDLDFFVEYNRDE